ncbi:unnamed protein product [Caenorhabditis auriculariae]|uniref:Peptidase M12B domain-containing protein n=1 Tax=Caenorhabditis auriculariae TaxID=2777116 RepID=A0A8S1HMP1_9PELO|nr:unnamed protein product [Caenorhabditis auriculariae]
MGVSGVQITDNAQLFTVDRHFVRRRRKRSAAADTEPLRSRTRLRGIARDCGHACHLRLRSHDSVYVVHLHRWSQIPAPHNKSLPAMPNSAYAPLVLYLDAEDTVNGRMSRASADCIYRARVVGVHEHSIVNLCDSDDGLYGLLALKEGVHTVEPIQQSSSADEEALASDSRRVHHAVRPFETHHFRAFDHTNATAEQVEEPESYANATWEDINDRKARSRRSANSWDHYVEVLVVADTKMYEYHGHSLEDYILTLFSTVASIYRHQSLRASINVVVVKIIILKHENAGPRITNNAQSTLQEFCRWQQLYNDPDDDSVQHHDVAILLTRGDICRSAGKCDTLGLAELGTMCDTQKSCAIIEDNGLSAGFTIAHELGHVFSIPHDDERKCGQYMQLNKMNYHIMAPTLEYNTHPWSWSQCSANMLERFLDNHRGQIQCLFDQPVERRYYDEMFGKQDAPGRKYDVHQQCRFVFGPHATVCPYMPTCRRLWCSTILGTTMGCRTQHMPWADGTVCDESRNMFCHRGHCVNTAPEQRPKTDGQWGDWRPWGDCSRTCGGGVQKALRDCDKPRPENGGKYCVGQRERYRSCNTQECPWDTPGFREVQCSEFNNKDIGIHGVPTQNTQWLPKYAGVAENERCKLYCRVSGSAGYYLLKEKVRPKKKGLSLTELHATGTATTSAWTGPAWPPAATIISSRPSDATSAASAAATTPGCRIVKGTFNERGTFGYNEVMKIPAGSANIDIRQHGFHNKKDDDNYLSLRSSNGEFLLNGHYQVSMYRQQIPIQDVVLEYSGSDHAIERINGTGPIRNDIYVHVLTIGNNPPDISYEYMMSVESPTVSYASLARAPNPSAYYWRLSDAWNECDRVCQGRQTQQLICMDASTNRQTNDRNCRSRRPTQPSRMCNIECTTKWSTEDTTSCSARCGSGQKRQRVGCVKVEGDRQIPTLESNCDRASRPSDVAACYVDCSGRRWTYGEWSSCSETCGTSGVQRRNAYCTEGNAHHRVIEESLCDRETREVIERDCGRVPCPRWVYGHWSECSRSCDGGVRMRHAQCLDAADRETHHNLCGPKHTHEACNEHVCTWWSFGTWSDCSVSCGEGIQHRAANCTDRQSSRLPETRCNKLEKIVTKACQRINCPSWKLGEWSQCSVTCDDGWSLRRVSCVDGAGRDVELSKCGPTNERPASHKTCNLGSCPFWRTTDWGPCSVTCGNGMRERTSECLYREQIVDSSFCGDAKIPDRTQQCNLMPCTSWETSSWSPCSVTCGTGEQSRTVHCVRGNEKAMVEDYYCDRENRPRDHKICEKDACDSRRIVSQLQADVPPIRWATGPWSPCSASCGNGTQRRLLKCRDHVRDLPEEYCSHLEREPDTRVCSIKPCTYWKSGPWMACPATCGAHVQQSRSVLCVGHDGSPVIDTDCDIQERPPSAKNCRLEACPRGEAPLGKWQVDEWSKCSASCGGGWRRRGVVCSLASCDETRKPRMFDRCNEHVCPPVGNSSWQISPWTHCSVSCGEGVQRRRVWCEDAVSGRKQDDPECAEKKPSEQRDCDLPPCPTMTSSDSSRDVSSKTSQASSVPTPGHAIWQTSPWNSCSAKCGRGVKRRTIACVDVAANETVASSRCDPSLRPREEIRCRVTHCPRWRGMPWSACSVTCGEGMRTREVFCQRGRRQKEARCFPAACPAYSWTTTPWSKCKDDCSLGERQTRRVYCMSNTGKRAAPRMCEPEPAPSTAKLCDVSKCPYEWVPDSWNTCSKTCGVGIQIRNVECRLKLNESIGIDEPAVPTEKCEPFPKPEESQTCQLNSCEAEFKWYFGPWSGCSSSCGQGVRHRKLRCQDSNGKRVDRLKCEELFRKPRRTQFCFERNCLPSTCQEMRAMRSKHEDGDYTLLLDGYPITVYCHMMNDTIPRAYITLNPETNYAEIYGKKLIYPSTCPHNGERNDSCLCSDDGDSNAGLTTFSKIRVDLPNRKVHLTDYTFATKVHGNFVPYATAGDCYSMRECPQGRFSLDFQGTSLRVVDDLNWEDQGHRTASRIDRTLNNAKIEGRCGGYCGKCAPERFKGLIFEIDPRGKKKWEPGDTL